MQTLKDIFVPYEIAQKLNEIGFEEECIAVYSKGKLNIFDPNDSVQWVMFEGEFFAPTWEQVKKWFREKGFYGNIQTGLLSTTIKITVVPEFENEEYFREVYDNENHYEEAREQLIYKLIEIYEKGK